MSVVAIIPAHMTSARFPGKVLADICGKPMLERVVERVQQAKLVDEIVIALDGRKVRVAEFKPFIEPAWEEEELFAWVQKTDLDYYLGVHEPKDLLTLFCESALYVETDTIVRITSDCPLMDPALIDFLVSLHRQTGGEYTSNIFPTRTFPDGLDVEVFSMAALAKAHAEAQHPHEREHVTPYLQNKKLFRVTSVVQEPNYAHIRWTVDYPEDLEHVRRLYERLPAHWGWGEALKIEEELRNG